MRRPATALLLLALPLSVLAACGGDDEPERAATAEPGSEFCERAAEAETLGDAVSELGTDPAEAEAAIGAALESGEATLELAPQDIVERMTRVVDYQRQVAEVLEANDWDVVAAVASDEGAELFGDEAAQAEQDEVREYLEDTCGIENDSDDPVDTTASAGGTEIDLPDGEAGIDRFIDLYAIGTETEVTDEQRACLQGELRDTVTVEQLELLIGGGVDEQAQVAIGLAFLTCDVIEG